MKKILEVLRYGEHDIRFNTDFDVHKDPEAAMQIAFDCAISMATRLWGGNEDSVLAMLRAVTIADLALSVNREEMVRILDHDSKSLAKVLLMAKKEFEHQGGKVHTFMPSMKPPKKFN